MTRGCTPPTRSKSSRRPARLRARRLIAVEGNPIDAMWSDRPAPPAGKVVLHDIKFAGEQGADKLRRIRAELTKSRLDALLVSDPQNVAWTFNIRGSDVGHTPLPLGMSLIPREGRPSVYFDGRKLDNAARAALEDLADVREPAALENDLDRTQGQDGAARSRQRGGGAVAAHRGAWRQGLARRRSDHR